MELVFKTFTVYLIIVWDIFSDNIQYFLTAVKGLVKYLTYLVNLLDFSAVFFSESLLNTQ